MRRVIGGRLIQAVVAAAVLCGLPQGATARPTAPAVTLRHCTLWTATGSVLADTDLQLQDGRVAAIGKALPANKEGREIDCAGQIVTPGLVDMHSHIGVYPVPTGSARQDGNEMSNPLTPQVRAVDSFDPEDASIARAVAAGVTTALVLPGSGNAMGGQALYIKLFGRSTAEMTIPGAPRAMKWAMGENPKRAYGSKGQLPMSRMGHAWLLRQRMTEARDLRHQQDAWDRKYPSGAPADGPARPFRAELEPLVALLRGQVLLHVHCYEVHDMETLFRVADEFGFKVAAVHHALEAWKIPKTLAERGVAAAIFSDLWGFKLEALDGSVYAPKILQESGVQLALKTDHPVIDAQYLMFEAAKAHHYGLGEQAALQAVTRNPARSIGLGDRIGTLEAGKEADIVLWDRSPLALGAKPLRVFVDGHEVVAPGKNVQSAWSTSHRAAGAVCACQE